MYARRKTAGVTLARGGGDKINNWTAVTQRKRSEILNEEELSSFFVVGCETAKQRHPIIGSAIISS